MESVTCYLAEAFFDVESFNHEKYYVAEGDEQAVWDAFVHFQTIQELLKESLNQDGGEVLSVHLGRLRICRTTLGGLNTTLGGLNPERGVIEKTTDRILYDSDDVESSIVAEIPEFLTLGVPV
jgi:hypothetical protein